LVAPLPKLWTHKSPLFIARTCANRTPRPFFTPHRMASNPVNPTDTDPTVKSPPPVSPPPVQSENIVPKKSSPFKRPDGEDFRVQFREFLDAKPTPPRTLATALNGVFVVDKPLGLSSAAVVGRVRFALEYYCRASGDPAAVGRSKRKPWIKVGHGGTLDPLASGVLVIGVGNSTKDLNTFLKGDKEYITTALFGYETATMDSEGEKMNEVADLLNVSVEAIEKKLPEFIGDEVMQRPPQFSALKKDGVRAYKRARDGEDFELEPRPVKVVTYEMLHFDLPRAEFRITCGGGTYVRSLVQDLARAIGSAAHVAVLRRTKQGQFGLDGCVAFDDLQDAEVIINALKKGKAVNSDGLDAAQ